jgi:hypothetical protein
MSTSQCNRLFKYIVTWFNANADSVFDVWSPAHVVYGIILAGGFHLLLRYKEAIPSWWSAWFMWVMTLVIGWERFEFTGELGYWGGWFKTWLNGYENWFNRYVLDVVAALIGCAIWRRWPWCFWPVTAVGIIYEIANLMAPTANYYQLLFFGE